jgi:transposase InsO family protein
MQKMPWKERTVMSERERFLAEAISGEESFSAVCRRYGISRKTGYKWLHRAEYGESLNDLSRKPLHSPRRTSSEVEALVLGERDQHPAWGPRKLERALLNKGYERIPCKSTIENILKRNNRIEPEASEAATPFKRFERSKPNELWQMDFKGDFGMLNGQRCYPLTILDDHSRFSLCLNANNGTNYTEFKPVFARVLEEYGLPDTILCDNGKPWGDSQGGITSFEVWMMQLGVLPIHGRPLHPQTQGKDERFHRTLKRELLSVRPIRDQQDAQSAFDRWRHEYNCERPHEALKLDVPAKHYRPSKHKFDGTVNTVEYDKGARLRKVNYKGYLSIQKHRYYLSEALIGEYIELVDVDEDLISLHYGAFEIAKIDVRQRLIVSKYKQRVR